jgi:hypothetical protein
MASSPFWRVRPTALLLTDGAPNEVQPLKENIAGRISSGCGLFAGDLDSSTGCATVQWIGAVDEVHASSSEARVTWRDADLILKPSSSGKRYWRDFDWFNFAPEVADRYMLEGICAEAFDDLDWRRNRKRTKVAPLRDLRDVQIAAKDQLPPADLSGLPYVRPSTNPTVGHVYLFCSQHGYKIGKAINVKSRTKLFEVKLPFVIEVVHAARFDDYSRAEKALHLHFHEKRLEGEWFDLNEADIEFVKSFGVPVSVPK